MEYGAVLAWWLLFAALALAGLPIAATILTVLPDRGAGLALPLALVVLVMPIYWLGHVAFSLLTVGAGVIVLAGVTLGTAWRGPAVDGRRFVEGLAVFTIAFGLLVAVRAVDPSIQALGGEKFLDYGLLNAVLRSSRLPPGDMWFAGASVQYYYGGHLTAGVLTSLAGTPARLAYNLALAGFYGTLVAAAYGVTGAIAAARGTSYRLAGATGALLVGFAANLVMPVQLLLWILPRGLADPLARAVAGATALPLGALRSIRQFSYWTASRVIRDGPGNGGYNTINEFPLFAFLNGDLHAHMMSTPFLLLVVGLAFAYYRTPADALWRRRALVFGAIPPVAGLVAVVNTWSFPSTIGVTILALVFAASDPMELLPGSHTHPKTDRWAEARRLGAAIFGGLAVGILGVAWALPFFVGPATGASGRSLGLFPPRSGLLEFLLVHGWVLAVFGSYLGARAWLAFPEQRDRLGFLVLVVVVGGLLADAAAVALVLPLLAIAWVLLRRVEDIGFESVLFIAGAGLVLIVEFVFIEEQAGPGRMNTVFKTYMQVWVLWATGTAAALVGLVSGRGLPLSLSSRHRRLLRVAGVALIIAVSLYGLVALGVHFGGFVTGDRGPTEATLDATTWAAVTHPAEWQAIQWLDARPGQPHIVTAPGCWCNPVSSTRPYTWVNAPSSFTGIPTLAGWSHESGYRGRTVYRDRVDDVRRIYTGSPDERARLLAAYDVEYVWVGPNERDLYGESVEFSSLDGVEVAFQNEAVTIYRITSNGR